MPQTIRSNRRWVAVLTATLAILSLAAILDVPAPAMTVVAELLLLGGVFALNSALHSYLILAFAQSERITTDVGFYCMSNVVGRLVGPFCAKFVESTAAPCGRSRHAIPKCSHLHMPKRGANDGKCPSRSTS